MEIGGIRLTNDAVEHSRLRKLALSYAPDWSIVIVLLVATIATDGVQGFRRNFSLADTSLHYPYALQDTVSNGALLLIAIVAPIILQFIINYFTIRSKWDYHVSVLALFMSISFTGTITHLVKLTVGRARPDIIARCMPLPGSVDPPNGVITANICTQTNRAIMLEGFRSFPSGHSSMAFAGLGLLSCYMAGKLHVFDTQGHIIKVLACMLPLGIAAFVAISRTEDSRHHSEDVIVGSLLGLSISYLSYRQYFPPLTSRSSSAYPPRIDREVKAILPLYNPLHSRNSSRTHEEYEDGGEGENVELLNEPGSKHDLSDQPFRNEEDPVGSSTQV